jgi:Co/Zn/Cd efflux system component
VFVLWESLERFFEPPEVNTDRLLLVSVLGLLVNLLGVWAFQVGVIVARTTLCHARYTCTV